MNERMTRYSRAKMKYTLGTLAMAAAIVLRLAAPCIGQTARLGFDPAACRSVQKDGYDVALVGGCDLMHRVGQPQLPVKYIKIAIPRGTRAAAIHATYANAIEIPGEYSIRPAQPPVPTSASSIPARWAEPDASIYSSSEPYPGTLAELLDTGSLGGHRIADIVVYPVQYVPASGKLILYTQIEVEVELEAAPADAIAKRTLSAERMYAGAVRAMVENPEDVEDQVAKRTAPIDDTVEYLVIYRYYLDRLQPLIDWKTKKGVPTEAVSYDWIMSHYTGPVHDDPAERIRECIKDYYLNHGTVFVLLAGDVSWIPARMACVRNEPEWDAIPADLYYSDLDGTWNADGDGYYGEYPADCVDLYSDVWLARASVSNATNTQSFVNKVLQYEGEAEMDPLPLDYEVKVLMLGSYLDDQTDGAILKHKIDLESIPDECEVTELYQRYGNLGRASVIAELNSGHNFVNHVGHGYDDGVQIGEEMLYGSDLFALTNGPRISAVMYSTSCSSGAFDSPQCFAEDFLRAPNGGGFYVGNSRSGWYYVGWPSEGLSARFDRYFFNCVYPYRFLNLGRIHCEAKNMGVGYAKDNDTERFVLYALNLLGDAELPVWTQTPQAIHAEHADWIPTGPSELPVTIRDDGGDPVLDALVTLYKEGEVYLSAQTDDSGLAVFHPAPETPGTLFVTATKPNHLPYQGEVAVGNSGCKVTTAPDPLPGGEGSLFGEPRTGFPGWVWFSIPLEPENCCGGDDCADPTGLLGFDAGGILCKWDRYAKATVWYQPPFADWDLAVGESYLCYIQRHEGNPSYQGRDPQSPFSTKLGRMGWTWIGKPGDSELGYPDFMDSVTIQYPVGGPVRTAAQDRAAPDPWCSWSWSFWDTYLQAPKTMTPYAPFGTNKAYPWVGYRAYVRVGTATAQEDPDQPVLIWP
jgi:hypothetical protein